jgi:dihydrofolate synthase/folylpolyglutamate synthase
MDLSAWWPEIARWSAQEMVFGLTRMQTMQARLAAAYGYVWPPALTVGGTNGKGSSVALLAAIYQAAGFSVGAYFSPHLWAYRERFRLNGVLPEEQQLSQAFEKIATLRQDLPLTYFEVATLAAVILFAEAHCDLMILEVGLGGRLDAVNAFAPQAALVTNIGFDHQAWLGDTLAAIAYEKAGIFRAGRPAIIGMPDAPVTLYHCAESLGAELYRYPEDFSWEKQPDGTWDYRFIAKNSDKSCCYKNLPPPALKGQHQYHNAAAVLTLVHSVQALWPVPRTALAAGLQNYFLPGRLQSFRHRQHGFVLLADVAHNQESAAVLADYLCTLGEKPWLAVFAALSDKPLAAMLKTLASCLAKVYLAQYLPTPRAATWAQYQAAFAEAQLPQPEAYPEVCQALSAACATIEQHPNAYQGVVLWGSFYTLAAARDCLFTAFTEEKSC